VARIEEGSAPRWDRGETTRTSRKNRGVSTVGTALRRWRVVGWSVDVREMSVYVRAVVLLDENEVLSLVMSAPIPRFTHFAPL
jgi:hypothetical protein